MWPDQTPRPRPSGHRTPAAAPKRCSLFGARAGRRCEVCVWGEAVGRRRGAAGRVARPVCAVRARRCSRRGLITSRRGGPGPPLIALERACKGPTRREGPSRCVSARLECAPSSPPFGTRLTGQAALNHRARRPRVRHKRHGARARRRLGARRRGRGVCSAAWEGVLLHRARRARAVRAGAAGYTCD